MKQKILKFVLVQIFFGSGLFAQIPNADFENWTLWGGWFSNPDWWSTNNSQITSSMVEPDSDAYTGSLAMHLYNYGSLRPWASTRFASSNNINAVNAFVKLKVIYNDTVSIVVREFYNGALADSGMWIGTADILNYNSVVIPVTQNNNSVDTIEIEITGGNKTNLIFEGTSFLVDNLQLNPSFIIIDDPVAVLQNVYPNPVHDAIYVPLNEKIIPSQVKIFDCEGKEVRNFSFDYFALNMTQIWYGAIKINLSSFANGVYFLQVNSVTIRNYKFIKQ